MAKGIDVSSNNRVTDWSKVKGSGVEFAFIKATEGVSYADPTFHAYRDGAKAAGLKVGSYHFARPDNDNPPEAEADHYIATVKPQHDEAICLDIEREGVNTNYWCERFVNRVYALTQRHPYVYSYAGFLSHFAPGSTALGSCPLWVAAYQTKPPTIRLPWKEFHLWQHADNGKVPGITGAVDLNDGEFIVAPAPPAPHPAPTPTPAPQHHQENSMILVAVDEPNPRHFLIGSDFVSGVTADLYLKLAANGVPHAEQVNALEVIQLSRAAGHPLA